MFTLKLKATCVPDLAILWDRHLRKGAMHIQGNDFHDRLLSMVSNQGSQQVTRQLRIRARSGRYRSAPPVQAPVAAVKSKERPGNNSSSQFMRYFGLPAIRAPIAPIPVDKF